MSADTPPALRVVLDTNAVDPIVELPGALDAVATAIVEGRLELLTTFAGKQELANIPDPVRRAEREVILRYATVVADGGFIFNRSRFDQARLGGPELDELRAGNDKHTDDALIAAAAMHEKAVLITADKRLRGKATRLNIAVMTPAEFLAAIGYPMAPNG